MSNYTSEQITRDAVQFAESRFGQHYLSRLEKALERCLTDAENLEYSDSFRANRASQAATVRAELNYFTTAKTVASSPTMMKKLRDKALKRREEPEIDL